MLKYFFSLLAFCILIDCSLLYGQRTFFLSGVVADSVTNERLAAANVRIVGTSKGTITNAQGEYKLSLESSVYHIIFSYLGYRPETSAVSLSQNTNLYIRLKPSAIQLPEVVVLAEDPALEIIRKAIASKHKWMDSLKSYRFEAFTRQVLRRDTAIASITESYTTGYMLVGDTLREVVKQRRQTENIPTAENFAAVRHIVNFNEDEIRMFSVQVDENSSSYAFVGPTAPDALDYYDYKLLSTSVSSGVDIYKIKMTPKTRLKPLFDGIIMIADGTFAVMGIDLKPNETFTIPFIKDIDLRYRQQFNLYEHRFWMPTDIRINGGLSVSIIGFSLPRIGIDLTSSIYDYAVNVPIPDSILHKQRLSVDSTSIAYDSTFWKQNEVLPLTAEEQSAYKTIDSTQTLEKQFEPKGPLAILGGEGASSILNNVDVRYNRVEGFFFGGDVELNKLSPITKFAASAGYGFSDNGFKYWLAGTVFISKEKKFGFGCEVYRKLDYVPDGGFYSPFTIALMALIDKNDYRDYFLSSGWSTFITTQPSRQLNARISFINERHYTMFNASSYGLFSREKVFRSNPGIVDGNMRSVRLDFRFGPQPAPLDIVSRNALEVSIEHSSPSLAKSEFDFTRYSGTLTWNIRTFSRSLLFPPTLRISISGGTSRGILPPQRAFVLDSRASGYAPFGVLRGSFIKELDGDKAVMVNIEHNFRSIPFLALNLPFLYRNGIEIVLHGSAAQTWYGTASNSDGWYYETGIGINRILDILRADITYRFKEPKRFFFTLSIANLF